MTTIEEMREALAKIAELADAAVNSGEGFEDDRPVEVDEAEQTLQSDTPGCIVKSLPERLLVKAAEYAARINPVNSPASCRWPTSATRAGCLTHWRSRSLRRSTGGRPRGH